MQVKFVFIPYILVEYWREIYLNNKLRGPKRSACPPRFSSLLFWRSHCLHSKDGIGNKRTEGKITTSKSVEENAFICRHLSLVCKVKHQGRMYLRTKRLVNLHIFYQALTRPVRIESSSVQSCHAISHKWTENWLRRRKNTYRSHVSG